MDEPDARRIRLAGGQRLFGAHVDVPGDPSSAAFPLVAGLITPGSEVMVEGVLMNPLRIAIAEDNWFIAEYLCGELAALGHAIVGRARTGKDLITLVAQERPDLVLADIRLAHGSDGLAAAREVQERYDIPAIAATGRPPPIALP